MSSDKTGGNRFSVLISILLCFVSVCMFVLFFGRIYLVSCGKATGSYQGFDVDSEEIIYVGTMEQIRKIKNGKVIETISPPTTRSYCFYIENDTLFIGCFSDSKGGVYDLHGNEISYGNIRCNDVEEKAKGKTMLVNDHEYRVRTDIFGSYKVFCDGVMVYQSDNSFFDGFSYWVSFSFTVILFAVLVLGKLTEYQ